VLIGPEPAVTIAAKGINAHALDGGPAVRGCQR
jgi:hypothetical protein